MKVKGLSSDTRKLKKGDLFFALKGSKYNGDKFIKKALKKGACAVITSKKIDGITQIIKVNEVKDPLEKFVLNFIKLNLRILSRLLALMEKVL